MPQVMTSFLAGLFVGEGKFEEVRDNLDLERWFRLPKSHERGIHGHRHARIRIVADQCFFAFIRAMLLPSSVLGPVECWAFSLFCFRR